MDGRDGRIGWSKRASEEEAFYFISMDGGEEGRRPRRWGGLILGEKRRSSGLVPGNGI
jgi:hypothetical protein